MGLEATGRIVRVVIHPSNPDIVLAVALGHLYGPQQERGVFKTSDGGRTQRPNYYSRMAVAPDDANEVHIRATQHSVSLDGGVTITRCSAGDDNHDIWIDRRLPDRIVVGDLGPVILRPAGRP